MDFMMLKPVININLQGVRIFIATRCFLTQLLTQLGPDWTVYWEPQEGLLYWKIVIACDISHHRLGLAGTLG